MQTHTSFGAKILSLALTFVMVGSMLPSATFAAAVSAVPEANATGTIKAFDKLENRFAPSTGENAPAHVYALSVVLNTPEEELRLPATLGVTVERTVAAPVAAAAAPDTAVSSQAAPEEQAASTIDTAPAASAIAPDTAAASGSVSAAPSAPAAADSAPATEDSAPASENSAPASEPAAPAPVTTVQQETVPVTWSSDKAYQSAENGKFAYTAVLPEGYALADGVALPQIYVMVGKQARAAGAVAAAPAVAAHPTITEAIDLTGVTRDLDCNLASGHTGIPCWMWNHDTKVLTLNGFHLAAQSGVSGVLVVPKDTVIQLMGENKIENTHEQPYYALYLQCGDQDTGTLTIQNAPDATGSLSLEAVRDGDKEKGSGIHADGNVDIRIVSGTVTAKAYVSGIRAVGGKILIEGGNVTASVAGSNSYSIGNGLTATTGGVVISGGKVTIAGGASSYDRAAPFGIYGSSTISGADTEVSIIGRPKAFSKEPALSATDKIAPFDANGKKLNANDAWQLNNKTVIYKADIPVINISTQPVSPSAMDYGAVSGSLTVAGTASNNNPVSYQWYENTTNSTTGGTAIFGVTSASFTLPENLNAGTYYYYCVLQATDCRDKSSDVATVTVTKAGATDAMKAASGEVDKRGDTAATVTIPALPAGAAYGTITYGGAFTCSNAAINGTTLTYTAPASTEGTKATITLPVTGAANYDDYTLTVTLTSGKAAYKGEQAAAPSGTPAAKTNTGITLAAVTAPENETIEYASSTTNAAPATGWQDGTAFTGLTANTQYYFFARVKANNDHTAGTASAATAITTAKNPYTGTEASAPNGTPASKTSTGVTLAAVSVPTGETAEYAYSPTNTAPAAGWQDSTAFTGLTADTQYYFFARVKENGTHAAGKTSTGTAIKTDKPAYHGTEAAAPSDTPSAKSFNGVTLAAVTAPAGEAVEYAYSLTSTAPTLAKDWQSGTAFIGLNSNTQYYFFARVKANDSHAAGAASAGTPIKTEKEHYGGEQAESPSNTPASKTGTSITLEPVLPPRNEAVEYACSANGVVPATGWQDSPTFTGLKAGTPYAFFARVKESDTHAPGYPSTGTVITTDGPLQGVTISGVVSNSDAQLLPGATVTLMQGDRIVRTTATNSTGVYSAAGIMPGVYKIVVTNSQGVTITELVTIGTVDASKNMQFLDKKKNTVVETAPGAPDVAVGGMTSLLSNTNIGTTLSAAEREAVDNGGSAELKFKVALKTGSEAAADKSKLEALGKGIKIDTVLDLTVFKTVKADGGSVITDNQAMPVLAANLEIIVPIPENLRSKASLCVYRIHGEAAQALLKITPDANGEYYEISADGTYALVHVKSFSTYALGYTESTPAPSSSSASGTATLPQYTITATAGPGGSISTGRAVVVYEGESAGFSILPSKGYQIADVVVNGKSIGAKNSYVFTNIRANQTIHATFKQAGHVNPQTGIAD